MMAAGALSFLPLQIDPRLTPPLPLSVLKSPWIFLVHGSVVYLEGQVVQSSFPSQTRRHTTLSKIWELSCSPTMQRIVLFSACSDRREDIGVSVGEIPGGEAEWRGGKLPHLLLPIRWRPAGWPRGTICSAGPEQIQVMHLASQHWTQSNAGNVSFFFV